MAVSPFRPRSLLTHLTAYGVDFVVIGGIAALLHGSDLTTSDLDICPDNDPVNLELLGKALIELDATLRGVEEDVPFVPDGRTLSRIQLLTLDTSLGPLDILIRPDGSPPYSQLKRRAVRMDIGAAGVAVTSIDDLIAMKEAAGRDRDHRAVAELKAIKRLRRRLRRAAESD